MLAYLRRRFAEPQISPRLLRHMDETLVIAVAHHRVVYLSSIGWMLLGVGFWALVPWWLDGGWLLILIGLGLLLFGGFRALQHHMDRFVLTNMRVFRVTGVLGQQAATMPLSRVLDITVKKPLLGRLLGYGHFVFESAAQEQGLHEIHFVPRPDELDLLIQEQVQRAGLRGRQSPQGLPVDGTPVPAAPARGVAPPREIDPYD